MGGVCVPDIKELLDSVRVSRTAYSFFVPGDGAIVIEPSTGCTLDGRVVTCPSPQRSQPGCPSGPRVHVGGGVGATGFFGVLGLSGSIGVNVSVPTASLSNFRLRGIQVSLSGSITPLAGIGVFLGAGPTYSAGGSNGGFSNLSGLITPTSQVGAGNGAGVEVGTDFTSPMAGSVAMGRIAGGAYGAVGARFSGTASTSPIGCRPQ